jgi:CxxC motif-containing protein (DUF1111 family)
MKSRSSSLRVATASFALAASSIAFAQSSYQARMGEPIQGLTVQQLDRFTQGKAVFNHTFVASEGLGPIFNAENCAHCQINPIKPYTDFLAHDMESLGDGIVQGQASEHLMRTAPLWGMYLRGQIALLHDGRAGGAPTFAGNVRVAIADHDGEGLAASQAFAALHSNE